MLRCQGALLLLMLGTGVATAAAAPDAAPKAVAGTDRVIMAPDGDLDGLATAPGGFALVDAAPGIGSEGRAAGTLVAVRIQPTVAPVKNKTWLPEPATWVMLIGGMYGIGGVLRRRQRVSDAAFTARVRAIAADQDGSDRP